MKANHSVINPKIQKEFAKNNMLTLALQRTLYDSFQSILHHTAAAMLLSNCFLHLASRAFYQQRHQEQDKHWHEVVSFCRLDLTRRYMVDFNTH